MKDFNLKETIENVRDWKEDNFRPVKWYEDIPKRIFGWVFFRIYNLLTNNKA